MKLSEAALEIEEYMSTVYMAYGFKIDKVEKLPTESYVFHITEMEPMGGSYSYKLVVTPLGVILNKNGDDIIKLALSAYTDNQSQELFGKFKDKWYKEIS